MLASNSQCREMESKEEDDRMRTVDSLRGRLLAERVASKAAKDEAENLAKRLEELEKKLDEEIKCKNRAEKRIKYALKKLESLRLLDDRNQLDFSESSESSSSSQNSFLGFHRSEGAKSGTQMEDSGQCGSPESVKDVPISDDLSGSSFACLHHHQLASQDDGSWSSSEIAQSQLKDESHLIGNHIDVELQELSNDALRLPSGGGRTEEKAMQEAEHEDDSLALVPVSKQMSSDDQKPQSQDNVEGVLSTLRNVKEQLLHSLQRRTHFCSQKKLFVGHENLHGISATMP